LDSLTGFTILTILALSLNFVTGLLNAPNIVATMIASRAMSPHKALLLSTAAQLIGPFLFGIAVAKAVGTEVIDAPQATLPILIAALSSALIWTVMAWYGGLPSSVSHAQVGGMIGAAVVALGNSAIHGNGVLKVFISLTLTAPLGILGGFYAVRFCYWLARNASPRINYRFNQGQWVASTFLGLAIGTNSAQRMMGMITLGLILGGFSSQFTVPTWVIALTAVTLALGNLMGGGRMMRSIGGKFFQVRPIHGFGAELSSAVIIALSSVLGGPVSTTQLTSLAIIGAGSAERVNMVRWHFVKQVVIAWIVTIPATAALAGLIYLGLSRIVIW
jgi:inorganic phosphate transporter, PiT family